jgi:hypothetical protein
MEQMGDRKVDVEPLSQYGPEMLCNVDSTVHEPVPNDARAANKFLRTSRYQGDIPETSTSVRPPGFPRVARAPL